MISLKDFEEIWVVDYEYFTSQLNIPVPVCYCAYELLSGKEIRKWVEGENYKTPDYSTKDNALFVSFNAPAEMGCHLVLKYPTPLYILDLYAEFRNITNGKYVSSGKNMLGACIAYGVGGGDASLKNVMRSRILQGPPYNDVDRQKIMDYCMKDVELTTKLYHAMIKDIDLPPALFRGRYMLSIAHMENNGVPIDIEAFDTLKSKWDTIKEKLVKKIDVDYNVYEGTTFKMDKFKDFLINNNIPWQLTEKGHLRTDDDFMEDMAKSYPILGKLQQLRYALGQLKLNSLKIGSDGRNRAWLNPFGTKTGRNAASSSEFIFGNAVWVRNLIRPSPGYSISYCDYEQQEIGIGAALSGDENLIKAYKSGDPYISFGQMAGVLPEGATKYTHPEIRERFKTCFLAVNYGMSDKSLAIKAGITDVAARELLQLHRVIFRRYWEWIEAFSDVGQLSGSVRNLCGWGYDTRELFYLDTKGRDVGKYRTLQNFPCQSNGAEILHAAISMCVENDIKVIAPVHDALLIEAKTEDIEKDVEITTAIMEAASDYVIEFPLRVESKIITYPNHYTDPRGDDMWNTVWEVINEA